MGTRWEICARPSRRRGLATAVAAGLFYLMLLSSAAATEDEHGAGADEPKPPPKGAGVEAKPGEENPQIARMRREANETLLRGEFDRARREFEKILELLPNDGPAERDAARASQAAGQFEYAVEALEKAHHFGKHAPDPEVHYLRGEALYVLGRDAEAAREHRICELELGPAPEGRMEKLWLARVYARRGYVVLADRVYESMLPPAPKFDSEVSLNQADAHLLNKDWIGAARVLRGYLALDPKSVRGREMLAWALEAGGDLDGELAVRRSLAEDHPTSVNRRDYGRALERAANFRGARDEYGSAIAGSQVRDTALIASYERMRLRTTPEVAGGAQFRSDPQAWAWRLQTGGVLPFGSRHHVAAFAWHDSSSDWKANQVVGSNVVAQRGAVTGLAASLVLASRWGGWIMGSADLRVSTMSGQTGEGAPVYGTNWKVNGGGQIEGDTPLFGFAQINIHADLNEQWNEAPVCIEAGGVQTGVLGHLYLFPKSRVVLMDSGIAVRHLSLAPLGGPVPTANQLLAWIGVDFNLWVSSARVVRGESLDERLVRRTYLNDAGVIAYRHFELYGEQTPNFRIALAPRQSVNNGTLIVRKALFGGRAGFDLHGGLGYDNARDHFLAQAGAAVVVAWSWSTRLLASYDFLRDTATGLTGTLQIAWLTLHADI